MAWDIERWEPSNQLAETDDTGAFDGPEIVDADWSYVEPEPVEIDGYDGYELQPEPEPQKGGWGWGNDSSVEYIEPDVIDAPFSFLQPDESQLPVKKSGWGWGGNDKTDLEEMERYTSAWFESEPDTVDADYQYIDPETRGLENPYQRSTDDFFRTVEVGENPEPAPSFNPFAGFFGQSSTSQKADTWSGSNTSSNTQQRSDSNVRSHASTHQSTGSFTGSSTNNTTDNQTRNKAAPRTQPATGGSPPSRPSKPTSSAGSAPSVQQKQGSSSSNPDYGWYFIAQDDPREDPDVHALRHWYFLYEYGDGFEEWEEKKFHEWMQSLDRSQYQLYVDAGNTIMEDELVAHLKDGNLKTAYLSMRLEGDSPDSERNDLLGRVSAAFLRGFS